MNNLKQKKLSPSPDPLAHIKDSDKKVNYMKKNSLLIDDSFQERKEAINSGLYAFGNDAIEILIK